MSKVNRGRSNILFYSDETGYIIQWVHSLYLYYSTVTRKLLKYYWNDPIVKLGQ